MPIYEYRCSHCGNTVEFMQKMSDTPKTKCPDCHQDTLKKLISSTSFQLKGKGWYVTDFRDKGKPKHEKSSDKANEKSTEKSDEKSGEKSKDTKKTEKKDSSKKSE
jgi:putative FmdB family regulatory protein